MADLRIYRRSRVARWRNVVGRAAGFLFALWLLQFEIVLFVCFGIDIYDPRLLDLTGDIYR